MTSREFHIGDIVSAGAGMLVSPRMMEGVYDILSFMSGESVYTHQIPRISREATPVLLRQMPWLAEVFKEAEAITPDNHREILVGWVDRFGEMHAVSPMTADDHERIDPLSELAEKVSPDRIVTVSL